MDYSEFIIDDTQTEKIAMSIYSDIAQYIKEHKKEYEKWLENEAKK